MILNISLNALKKLQLKVSGFGFQHVNTFRAMSSNTDERRCKFLMVGGGSGGCAIAAKLARKYDDIIILEPSDRHYYQPLFTLIGAGIKNLEESFRPMKDVLPLHKAKWVQDSAAEFRPEENRVITANSGSIKYDYLVIATGLQLNFKAIPGLQECLDDDNSNVCSIYSPKYVEKTYECLKRTNEGKAIFTFPKSPVKCPGAPQKILYLAEEHFRKRNLRGNHEVSLHYFTALPVLFGVKKYAEALWEIIIQREINASVSVNLEEINPFTKMAIFQRLEDVGDGLKGSFFSERYAMLHVCPPMGPMDALKNAKSLVNEAGFVEVNKYSLQHKRFENIFALGDCTDSPNSKTAAAVAAQSEVLHENLLSHMAGREMKKRYDGYASCPLVTSSSKCILAEFDYNLDPLETFPVDQGVQRRSMYWMKKYAMPILYWNLMTKGYWNGPKPIREALSIFKAKEEYGRML